MTCRIFIITLVLSIPLGMVVSQCRMSRVALLRVPTSIYIYVLRSTPLNDWSVLILKLGPYGLFVKLIIGIKENA